MIRKLRLMRKNGFLTKKPTHWSHSFIELDYQYTKDTIKISARKYFVENFLKTKPHMLICLNFV